MAKGQYREAEDLALKSIALNDRKNFEVENALAVKLQLARLFFDQHDLKRMKGLLATVDESIIKQNARLRLDWSRLMASAYEQTGKKDSALHLFKQYFALRDSLADEQKHLMAADVARQLRDKEQQLQIAVLKEERQHATMLLVAVIVFAAMVIAILYLLYRNFRRSKKSLALALALNEEIKRQRAAREQQAKEHHKQMTEAVIKAQEKERSVIGLELHDNINQVLTTIKLQNEMVLEGIAEPKAILPRSTAYLQSCINEIRSLSKRLSAPTLGKISLEESVKDLIDSINETSKVKIIQQISGLDNELLKQDLHLGVYRILQEQLNNVLKHADATEVVVKLEQTDGQLHLLVSDNGKGFLLQGQKQGIGLVNMQTRAENLNGTFELSTRPGKGCRVKVVLPCLQ
jgi:signal transduction histidine kinase